MFTYGHLKLNNSKYKSYKYKMSHSTVVKDQITKVCWSSVWSLNQHLYSVLVNNPNCSFFKSLSSFTYCLCVSGLFVLLCSYHHCHSQNNVLVSYCRCYLDIIFFSFFFTTHYCCFGLPFSFSPLFVFLFKLVVLFLNL